MLCVFQPAELYKIHFDSACPWMTCRQAVLEHPCEKLAQFISTCLGLTPSEDAASSCFSILFHKLLFQLHLFNQDYCQVGFLNKTSSNIINIMFNTVEI